MKQLSQALNFMIDDIVEKILISSENPLEYIIFIAKQLRELIDVKVVVLLKYNYELNDYNLFTIYPEQHNKNFNSDIFEKIALISQDEKNLFYVNSSDNRLSKNYRNLLLENGISDLISMPLYAGSFRTGMLLLVNFATNLTKNQSILNILEKLKNVISLLLSDVFYFDALKNKLLNKDIELINNKNLLNDIINYLHHLIFILDENKNIYLKNHYANNFFTDMELILLSNSEKYKDIAAFDKNGEKSFFHITEIEVDLPMQKKGILIIGINYTEAKLYEESLTQHQDYLNKIIDLMPSIIISITKKGIIAKVNEAAITFFRKPKENLIGKNLFGFIPELEYIIDKFYEISDKKNIKLDKFLINYDARNFFFNISIFSLNFDKMGEVILQMNDVTNSVNMETLMIQTEKMTSIAGLAAGMAHEINNPLGIIIQSVQNIQRRLLLESMSEKNIDDFEKYNMSQEKFSNYLKDKKIDILLDAIFDSGKRVSDIITNMLDFSRNNIDEKRKIGINKLIEKSLYLVSQDYNLKKKYNFSNIFILKDFLDDFILKCNITEMEQVFVNLLKNAAFAVKDNELQGKNPEISIIVRADSSLLKIEIIDNGIGIEKENQKRIFEPFFTTKNIGEGTGLGLAVCYYIIVNKHNGQIWVNSEMNKGSRFMILLPLLEEEE